MSKKDYELIAQALAELASDKERARRRAAGVDDLTAVVNTLAIRFQAANSRFDRARFRRACRAGQG